VKNPTPLARTTTRLTRLRVAVENLIFRQPDLDAVARGWEVHRPTPFRRVYRDPRWHSIVACAACRGTGLDATRVCPACDGRGTVRLADADAAVVR
jgi:hypothetical protein